MRIIEEVQLDFDDVLIKPNRSNISSRKEVMLITDIKDRNRDIVISNVIPIMMSNMTGITTWEGIDVMVRNNMLVAVDKFKPLNEWLEFLQKHTAHFDNIFFTIGMKDFELEKFEEVRKMYPSFKNLVIDVPNGYMNDFSNYVSFVRGRHPDAFIIAGNVVSGEMTQELILAGASMVKIGIGGGSQCFLSGTEIKTKNGYKNIEEIKVGDEVLTHLNNYKKVLTTFMFYNDKNNYNINGIKCTEDHRFYVINKNDKNLINDNNIKDFAFWIEAKDLDKEKHLLVKINE